MNTDTNKIKSIGVDISNLANDYYETINQLFKEMNNIPLNAWNGNKTNSYIDLVLSDKKEYEKLYKNLKCFSKKIISISDEIETCIKKSNGDNSNG